ncbi:MAG: hypothetical protein K5659_09340 [Lachnospiraceae bacterium]|nr:hypothetical protein [Lachnospiraceae bacterium]
MRKANAIISVIMLLLFLGHMIYGILVLTGVTSGGAKWMHAITDSMATLLLVHMILGSILTFKTIKACKKSGVHYFKENLLFWIRRISGFALFFFMLDHMIAFSTTDEGGVVRLSLFNVLALTMQILMVISLLVHLSVNIKPLCIALGFEDKANLKTDIIVVISVILLLAAIGFLIYFIRWQRI